MADTDTTTLEWTELEQKFHAQQERDDRYGRTAAQFRAAVEKEIATLTWHDVPEDGTITGPMSPILLLKEVIAQLELRPVVAFCYGGCLEYPDGPETATYSLVGVEIKTSKQHFRVYLFDTGTGAMPVAADWNVRS